MTRPDRTTGSPDEVQDANPTVPIAVPASLDHAGPDRTDPDRTDPDRTDPDRTDPDRTDPDRTERYAAPTTPQARTIAAPATGTPKRHRRGWLTRLAGADEEILQRAPADRPKFVSMGAVLIGTAAVAAVSAAFALNTAVKLSPLPAVLVALLWGVIILNLDRMLIVSMVTTGGLRRSLVTAVPRLVLAAVIGAIISMPLVLRIFQPEIDAELQQMRAERLNAAQLALNQDARFTAIPDLEQEEARLIGVASGQNRPDLAADPEVTRLREALAAKETEYTEAENALICERGGATCGSGVPGRGPIYEELNAKLERLRGERDALRAQLATATAAAQQRIDTGAQQEVAAAQADLRRVQDELAGLRAEKAQAENDVKEAEDSSDGLLARLQALERLSAGSWTMVTAHLALFLLFLCIEALPVLVKVLSGLGPPSLYDRLLAERERRSMTDDARIGADQEAQIAEHLRARERDEQQRAQIDQHRAAVPLALEQHRAEMQVEAGKRANAQLAAKQEELARQAIDVWGQVAAARTDAELKRWYEQQTSAGRSGAYHGSTGPGDGEDRGRAMSYSEYMARRKAPGGSVAQPAEPARGAAASDGARRPALRSSANGDHPTDPGQDADTRKAGSWDAYEGDVAVPPPAAPPHREP